MLGELRDCSLSAESAVEIRDDDATDSGFSHDFQNNDLVVDVPLSQTAKLCTHQQIIQKKKKKRGGREV